MNSRIFYRGPSQLDGAPILGIITGLSTPSRNAKTGDMLQTYILREDVPPPEAVRLGLDRSICGDCALRGDGNGLGRACYVQTKWAPLGIWKAVRPQVASPRAVLVLDTPAIRAATAGRVIRLGTYGDPVAIPLYVWEWLLTGTAGWTGYTHQWRKAAANGFERICMASVDTLREQREAVDNGWRTFRVRQSIVSTLRRAPSEPLAHSEIVCPASAEWAASGRKKITCQQCQLCRGASRPARSIVIVAHGNKSTKVGAQVLPFGDQ